MNRVADVAVIGGGTAGALTAAMLGRAGIATIIVDIHETYPVEFRCEKIHDDQVALLEKTGVGAAVSAAATPIREMWVARRGHFVGKMRMAGHPFEYGIAYEDLVNAARRQIPDQVQFIRAKATSISTSPDTQQVALSNGDTITARLIVMATGLNSLGDIKRTEVSKFHSVTFGFNIDSKTGFRFPGLTYHSERPGKLGYVTFFPIGDRMRVNLFTYHPARDPWLRQMRESPIATMFSAMPRLKRFFNGDIELVGDVRMRPVGDLYKAVNHYDQHGLVLIGDSFGTSCPGAGTGLNKVFTDVERLCNHHVPGWLATPGMVARKLQSFYDDPVKIQSDNFSMHEAYYIRSLAIDTAAVWRFRRVAWIGFNTLQSCTVVAAVAAQSKVGRCLI